MTYETLIKTYSDAVGQLAIAEINKNRIEMAELDLSSKESMTKLCTGLMQSNDEYRMLTEEIITLKSTIEVSEKQINIIRDLMGKDIFKSIEQSNHFLDLINE